MQQDRNRVLMRAARRQAGTPDGSSKPTGPSLRGEQRILAHRFGLSIPVVPPRSGGVHDSSTASLSWPGRRPEVNSARLPGGQPFAECHLAETQVGPRSARLVCFDSHKKLLSVGLGAEGACLFSAGGVAVSNLPLAKALLSNVRRLRLPSTRSSPATLGSYDRAVPRPV